MSAPILCAAASLWSAW